ncbi:MAG: extracellular solute-binding protein [Anaerolineae bacterium]|nr:extracellular solute-binding protein [Anaerolineae bacterium]
MSRGIFKALLTLALASLLISCFPKVAVEPTHEPVTLRFAYRKYTVELQSLLEQFQSQYPWIKIETVEASRFGGQITQMVRMGNVDVFRDGRQALSFAQQGFLWPLDEVQLGDWSDIRDDYFKGAWEGLNIQGQQWGIPAAIDVSVVYVNMDQADALRLQVPGGEWDLNDFVELVNKMNFPEGLGHSNPKLFGFCTSPELPDPILFVYLHGGKIVDNINAPSAPTFDDPLTVEAIKWYTDLFNYYQVAPAPIAIRQAFRRGGIYEAVVRGACGVWLGWYSNRGGLDTPYHWTCEWKMLPLPHDRTTLAFADVEGYFITKNCTHPQEALKLIRFLSDHWEAAGTRLPPRRSQAQSEAYLRSVREDVANVVQGLPSQIIIVPGQSSQLLEKAGGLFLQAVQRSVNEGIPADEVLSEAQRQAKSLFQSFQ